MLERLNLKTNSMAGWWNSLGADTAHFQMCQLILGCILRQLGPLASVRVRVCVCVSTYLYMHFVNTVTNKKIILMIIVITL